MIAHFIYDYKVLMKSCGYRHSAIGVCDTTVMEQWDLLEENFSDFWSELLVPEATLRRVKSLHWFEVFILHYMEHTPNDEKRQ